MTTTYDPITVEVLRNVLPAITNEMSHSLRRTSYNMMIYEVGDYCCGLLDTKGNLIAQNAGGVSHFVADLGVVVQDGMKKIPDFEPGDVVIANHQAVCGQHLNNICIYMPFFFEGELIGFPMIRAHWVDVGGYSTGFGGAGATDPWLEGLQFDQLRLYRAGKPNEDLMRMVRDNIRFPESSMGDLRAQIAACQLALRRLTEVFTKYGKDVVLSSIDRIFDETEARCRRVVAEFADGTYEHATTFNDKSPAADGLIQIKTKVTIKGDAMTIDLSECSQQRNSTFNARTLAAPYIAYKALTCPTDPVNQGSFRALEAIVPEGNFMMAKYPAAMAMWSMALPSVIDSILLALAPSQPTRIPAAHRGALGDNITFFGLNPATGKRFVVQSIEGGGWGGRPTEDGPSASVTVCQGDVRNAPIEALEQRFPIIVERRELRMDSGGAGTFRGGLGLDITVRNLVPGRWNVPQTGRRGNRPQGLWGGKLGGDTDRMMQLPGEEWAQVDRDRYEVAANARALIRSAGGGGWGEAHKRDPEAVLADVRGGYVSVESARDDYGVALNIVPGAGPKGITIDPAATAAARADAAGADHVLVHR